MMRIISKSALVLVIVFLCSSVAIAGNHRNCHFTFGNGVAEQLVDPPGSPYIGQIRLRIGGVLLDGEVDLVITDGFNVQSFNSATKEVRITGFAKGTWDFGSALGKFHTWEVDTSVLVPPFETSMLHGNIRTGPRRDADPTNPDETWGEGFFKHADATLTGIGWNRFRVFNQNGDPINEFTYYVWGKICDVDLKGIRKTKRN